MFKGRFSALSNRRSLFRGGAALSGAALASVGVPAARALAVDSVDDSRLKTVLDRGRVIVGTGATNPPWHYEDENGMPVGMDIDMAKLLAAGLFGIERADVLNTEKPRDYIEFVIQEANQRIPNLLTDKIDVNFQFMTVTAQRATQCEFTIPYYREAVVVLLLVNSPYNTTDDMVGKGVTISALQNPDTEQNIHMRIPDANVVQVPSIAEAIAALDAGRSDGAWVDLSSGQYFSTLSPDTYKYTDSWLPNTYSASVKPGDQIWLNYVNTVIHEALIGIDFPVYQVFFKKHFNVDLPSPVAGFPAEYK
jgi:polar amino acid transport system substrate-binding protein